MNWFKSYNWVIRTYYDFGIQMDKPRSSPRSSIKAMSTIHQDMKYQRGDIRFGGQVINSILDILYTITVAKWSNQWEVDSIGLKLKRTCLVKNLDLGVSCIKATLEGKRFYRSDFEQHKQKFARQRTLGMVF